jgi:hypothetical protein
MEDRELYKEMEKLAKKAKNSGSAKSRRSHLFVGMMLYLILAVMALGEEETFYNKIKEVSHDVIDEWNLKQSQ